MRGTGVRVRAIAIKEFLHLFRDWRALVVVLVLPIVELLLFSMAISFDVKNVPTVVVDADGTPASRAYVQTYAASDFFDVIGTAGGIDSVDELFTHDRAQVVVIVQPGFARALAAGEKAQVGVLIDGSAPNAAKLGETYAIALNQAYGRQVAASWADRQGLDLAAAGNAQPLIRTWYNPERSSSIFLIPGLMVVIIMIVTVQQTAVTLVRERDQHTMEQLLISPLRLGELMVGKLLPWTLLAFADLLAIAAVGMTAFGVPLRGDVAALAVGSALFVFCSLGLGLLISAITPTLETANVIALMASFLPAFMLSGFAFPLDSIPVPLQWVSCAFPGRYQAALSRAVFLKGAGWGDVWPDLAALAAYAMIVLVAATVLFRRRVRA